MASYLEEILKYSIIIPTFNNFEVLKPCIDSLIKNTDLTKADTEIIIVSNGCRDETPRFIMDLPEPFRPIITPNPLGYPVAANVGLSMASGDYIVLLNNDTILVDYGPNVWLNTLEESFKQVPECGVTGPVIQHNHNTQMDFVIFFCAMISRKCLDACGFLDPIFTPGSGEDIDFCIKAQLKGFKITQSPLNQKVTSDGARMVGTFPIYHAGEKTVHRLKDWGQIFNRNMEIINQRYGKKV